MKGRKRKNYLVFKEDGVGKRTLYGSFSSRKRAENAVLLDTVASNGDCPSSGVVLLEKGKMNGRPALGYESEKGHGERFPPPCGLPMNVSLLLLLRSALTVCKDYFGDGAAKCQAVLTAPECQYIPDIVPEAQYMGALAEQLLANGKGFSGNDLAYYEPFYLKEFVAAQSHVKGLL